MASLKCSVCGSGIHYHSEPEGIQFIFFKDSDWGKMMSMSLTSDEIESENHGSYLYAWKCPSCGAFAFFDADWHVNMIFKLISEDISSKEIHQNLDTGLLFDDYLWNRITEDSIPVKDIIDKYSGFYYVAKNEHAMFIYEDREMRNLMFSYEGTEVAEEA